MSYGYVQYNLQNQYQKIQNPRINYTYPNTNVIINNNNNYLKKADTNHPVNHKKKKYDDCFIF